MSDIFENFEQSAPPVGGQESTNPPSAGGKKPRKRRGPRKQPKAKSEPSAAVATVTAPAPKKPGRKPNPPKAGETAASKRRAKASPAVGGKLDLATIINATSGLSGDEARMVANAVRALQGVGKKSRGKIVAALGRLFP